MKLRNKKTGEIGHFTSTNWNEIALIIMDDNGVQLAKYSSLAGLNKEWEDYEEPKESKEPKEPKEPKKYWFINSGGETASYYEEDEEPEDTEACKAIGNYFETEEEAEKAVEKLKAWKRLKDKGFRFEGIKQDYTRFNRQEPMRTGRKYLQFNKAEDEDWMKENWADLDLLFGGEE